MTLVAYVVPVAAEGLKYQYEWTLLKKPTGSNTLKDQNEAYLHLSKLSEGFYNFKVKLFQKKISLNSINDSFSSGNCNQR